MLAVETEELLEGRGILGVNVVAEEVQAVRHFRQLMVTPLSRTRLKMRRRCCKCSSGVAFATRRSSMYAKQKSSPQRKSINEALESLRALFGPKGIFTNSTGQMVYLLALARSDGRF